MNDRKRESLFPSHRSPRACFLPSPQPPRDAKGPLRRRKFLDQIGLAEWFVTLTLKSVNEPVGNYNLNETSSGKVCIVLQFLEILRKKEFEFFSQFQ